MNNGDSNGKLLGAIGALVAFGTVYNLLVDWLERNGYSQGYMSIIVGVGAGVVLLAALPIIGARAFAQVVALYVAAGTPMAVGSMSRHAINRRRAEESRYGNQI